MGTTLRSWRTIGSAGVDVSGVAGLMDRFTLANVTGMDPDEFWEKVQSWVRGNPWEAWWGAYRSNRRSFLDTWCWGHDHDFMGTGKPWGDGKRSAPLLADGKVLGAMDDRHLSNLARAIQGGALVPERDVRGKRCLVVGPWCGEEMLLLHAMGASHVDGIEEVPEYAAMANLQLRAFSFPGHVWAMSLFSIRPGDIIPDYDLCYVPGVLYHLTDVVMALLLLWGLTLPGGLLVAETAWSPPTAAEAVRYLGPSIPGWNWYAPSRAAFELMLRDTGFNGARMAESMGGRATLTGRRSPTCPALVEGAAGLSRPDMVPALLALLP